MSINGYKPKWKRRAYLGPAARAKAKASCSKPERKHLHRRTPIRARDEARYRARVKEWLSQYHFCEWEGCTAKPTECHHSHGRRGRLLLWEDGWFALCQHHHDHVHRNPEEARRRGLLCDAGKFNDQSIVP